jgi:hypothetical protein
VRRRRWSRDWSAESVMLVYKHKDVEDYFVEVDGTALDEATCTRVRRAYEDGKVIYLKGLKAPADPELFASLDWSDHGPLKKLKSMQVVQYHDAVLRGDVKAVDPCAPLNSAGDQYARLLDDVFRGNASRVDEFISSVRDINAFLEVLIQRIFPNYRINKPSTTWRFSDTLNENLHLDVYTTDLPDHHIRIFTNLDHTYRIWHTSHTLSWLLGNVLPTLPVEFVRTATPGRICHDLNFKTFGGFDVAGREGAPKHVCFFAPGDVWLVDSRKVSHQIFFGRRAVSTEYQIDPASMSDPSKHYFTVVEAARQRQLRQQGLVAA